MRLVMHYETTVFVDPLIQSSSHKNETFRPFGRILATWSALHPAPTIDSNLEVVICRGQCVHPFPGVSHIIHASGHLAGQHRQVAIYLGGCVARVRRARMRPDRPNQLTAWSETNQLQDHKLAG